MSQLRPVYLSRPVLSPVSGVAVLPDTDQDAFTAYTVSCDRPRHVENIRIPSSVRSAGEAEWKPSFIGTAMTCVNPRCLKTFIKKTECQRYCDTDCQKSWKQEMRNARRRKKNYECNTDQ